jgi:hypothetical protein
MLVEAVVEAAAYHQPPNPPNLKADGLYPDDSPETGQEHRSRNGQYFPPDGESP